MDNKEIMLQLYEEAKQKRIVLNQEEFAKMLGKSRAHLFKKMEEIPDSITERARQLLETKNVGPDRVKITGSIQDLFPDHEERLIRLESMVSVILQTVAHEVAGKMNKQSSLVASELHKAAEMVSELRIAEFRRK